MQNRLDTLNYYEYICSLHLQKMIQGQIPAQQQSQVSIHCCLNNFTQDSWQVVPVEHIVFPAGLPQPKGSTHLLKGNVQKVYMCILHVRTHVRTYVNSPKIY